MLHVEASPLRPSADEQADALAWLTDSSRPGGGGLDVGSSSTALLNSALGKVVNRWAAHPYDPDDLGRCLRLIDRYPWTERGIARLAGVDPHWAALQTAWADLRASMERECGVWLNKGVAMAPVTYAAMCAILDGVDESERKARKQAAPPVGAQGGAE